MSEPGPRSPARHPYARTAAELAVTIAAFFALGAFLSFEHVALGITEFYAEVTRLVLLALGTTMVLTLVQRPMKSRLAARGGPHFANAFAFFATLVVLVVAFLALLGVLSIPATSFLVAVGGISIVIGFGISTITTNVISGAFMLTSFPIKIGQRIVITVNNQPGTITGISALFMTVTTDAGAKMVIPNAAIIEGFAFLLDTGEGGGATSLLARPGERVVPTIYPYPATVTEVTGLFTKVVTDSGQALTIPNQAILNGGTALVRLQSEQPEQPSPVAVGDQVRLSVGGFEGTVTEVGPYYFKVTGAEEEATVPMISIANGGVTVFKRKAGAEPQGGGAAERPGTPSPHK